MTQATEIYYDPDPKTTIIEADAEWVEGYFDLNEVTSACPVLPPASALACLLALLATPWLAS